MKKWLVLLLSLVVVPIVVFAAGDRSIATKASMDFVGVLNGSPEYVSRVSPTLGAAGAWTGLQKGGCYTHQCDADYDYLAFADGGVVTVINGVYAPATAYPAPVTCLRDFETKLGVITHSGTATLNCDLWKLK